MALILGIESTCDETAAAVVEDRRIVRSNVISSQVDAHALYGGVVPEIAGRLHVEHILPVVRRAIGEAGIEAPDLDAIAVAHRPGLIGCLVVGLTAAKTLAWTLDKPVIAVDHVLAHLYSVSLDSEVEVPMPAVGLVVSGGHTSLYLARSWTDVEVIGRTRDDAVGEAYDKAAAMLGLEYPGGPVIDRVAQQGDPIALKLPRPTLEKDSLDFSFSGLKTALLYAVLGRNGRERTIDEVGEQRIADACASFQAACVETLVIKLRRAVEQTGAKSVVIGGGVSANRALRAAVAEGLDVPAFVPPRAYCTDNAAMIAGLGAVQLEAGDVADLTLDATATVQR